MFSPWGLGKVSQEGDSSLSVWLFNGEFYMFYIFCMSTRACRAKNLFNWSINWRRHNIKASSLTPDMNWVVSFLQIPPNNLFTTFNRCQNLIATVLHTPQTLSKFTEPPAKGVKINLHSSSSLIHKCQNYFPYIYHPLQVFSSSLLMKTSCLRLKTSWVKLLSKFQYWWSE